MSVRDTYKRPNLRPGIYKCVPDAPMQRHPPLPDGRHTRIPTMANEAPNPTSQPRWCLLCGKHLVAIGHARRGGAAHHGDWKGREYHKACWKKLNPPFRARFGWRGKRRFPRHRF